jgi:transketolase
VPAKSRSLANCRRERSKRNTKPGKSASPGLTRAEFNAAHAGRLPKNIAKAIIKHKKAVAEGGEKKATRQWSGAALEVLTHLVPEMVGGSADLTGSNNTRPAIPSR